MRFPAVAPSGNHIPLRSQIPGHIFRQGFNRKPCPISQPNTGMHFPLSPSTGKCIPFHSQIPGWTFQNPAHPERPSHPEHIRVRFFSYLLRPGSAIWRPPGGVLLHESHRMVRKEARIRLAAVLHLTIHPANARDCIIQNRLIIRMMENIAPDACHSAPPCQEKSPEKFEAFTFVRLNARHRERRSYSPSTAFLAAAAMLSRSSLVGWSFAATQLSSSILNRALSGSCSSMAS